MSKDKLLAVLDLSEDEQWEWLWKNRQLTHISWNMTATRNMILADLAFRLRDEVFQKGQRYAYNNALEEVYEYEKELDKKGTDKAGWGIYWSQPIHWIIAALIAKETK